MFGDQSESPSNAANLYTNEAKCELLRDQLETLWSNFKHTRSTKLRHYEKMFECDASPGDDEDKQPPSPKTKRIHLCGYLVLSDNEPFLTDCLMSHLDAEYELTSADLISAARHGQSELTLHNLRGRVDSFDSPSRQALLEPGDDVYGNFLEILFGRLVRCNHHEQELRLRRLFFEAVVMHAAKMTCSANLLNLFLSNNHHVKQKLLDVYFPCLFFMTKTFDIFKGEKHTCRFGMLTAWFAKNFLSVHSDDVLLSRLKVDLVLLEFYGRRQQQQRKTRVHPGFNFKFELRLKELARRSFASVYLTYSRAYTPLLNAVGDSLRNYILYFNEIKNLF